MHFRGGAHYIVCITGHSQPARTSRNKKGRAGAPPLPTACRERALAIATGLALGVLFVRRQQRLTDPLIDPGLFHLPVFIVSLATNTLDVFVAVG
jgi:hypothetical protein